MTDLHGKEKVVAATIAKTVGLKVEQHDDGRQPGMHDLNIIATDGTVLPWRSRPPPTPTASNSGSW